MPMAGSWLKAWVLGSIRTSGNCVLRELGSCWAEVGGGVACNGDSSSEITMTREVKKLLSFLVRLAVSESRSLRTSWSILSISLVWIRYSRKASATCLRKRISDMSG